MAEQSRVTQVTAEILRSIEQCGPITFARFMETCLYSPKSGFYSTRQMPINENFTTSSHSHPEFGSLLAKQIEEMWRILGTPTSFFLVEVGCGDGSLARSIQQSIQTIFPKFSECLIHVASDLSPVFSDHWRLENLQNPSYLNESTVPTDQGIQKVIADGTNGFSNIIGCVLSNELVDNFPVHRFIKINGSIQEVFTHHGENGFFEVIGEPSTSEIPKRLERLTIDLPDGFRGEVNLKIDRWSDNLAQALTKGFVLTIDYGETAPKLYSNHYSDGTITCFRKHQVYDDPYEFIGEQDITSHVDFTSLWESGERYGLKTLGYIEQKEFLVNLGILNTLKQLKFTDGLSEAQIDIRRLAIKSLIDPTQMGGFKVLLQAKGINPPIVLRGFSSKTADQSRKS